jgi:hypothetical protein
MRRAISNQAFFLGLLSLAGQALAAGDGPTARVLLTGLEPYLLAYGLEGQLPRYFRMAAECEFLAGNRSEAQRLCLKGLLRGGVQVPGTDHRELVRLALRLAVRPEKE